MNTHLTNMSFYDMIILCCLPCRVRFKYWIVRKRYKTDSGTLSIVTTPLRKRNKLATHGHRFSNFGNFIFGTAFGYICICIYTYCILYTYMYTVYLDLDLLSALKFKLCVFSPKHLTKRPIGRFFFLEERGTCS